MKNAFSKKGLVEKVALCSIFLQLSLPSDLKKTDGISRLLPHSICCDIAHMWPLVNATVCS